MSTLITAACTARAYQVKNSLTDIEIILGDYEALPDVMISSGKMIKLPNPKDTAYLHEMLALCLDKGITNIYLLRQTEQEIFSEALLLFKEYGITINNIPHAL